MKKKEHKEKEFTWSDLKRAINRIPEKHLNKPVIIWTEGEEVLRISEVEVLKQDYLFDGDEGCCERSQMKEAIAEEKKEFPDTASEYYVVHPKGTRILYAE